MELVNKGIVMKKEIPLIASIIMVSSTATAQIYDPAPVDVTDGFAFVPELESVVRYDDNIYQQEDDKISSTILLITPSVKFGTDDGVNQYGGTYKLISGSYSRGELKDGSDPEGSDDFVDHRLNLDAHTEYTSKHRTDFNFAFNNLHENRGSGLTEDLTNLNGIDEVLKFNELHARGYYQYGGANALMRVGLGLAFFDKEFKNFIDRTKYNDYSYFKYFGDVEYQLGKVTYLTADLIYKDITYKHLEVGNESRDNQDNSALLGFKWKGLSKTTGFLKAGYQHKSFESNRKSFSGSIFDVGVVWKALQHSAFTFHGVRAAEDSDRVGDYIERLTGSVGWRHDWSKKFYSNIQGAYSTEDYIGDINNREDDVTRGALDLNYDITRWIRVTAGYELITKKSTADNIAYDKNTVHLGVNIAL